VDRGNKLKGEMLILLRKQLMKVGLRFLCLYVGQ